MGWFFNSHSRQQMLVKCKRNQNWLLTSKRYILYMYMYIYIHVHVHVPEMIYNIIVCKCSVWSDKFFVNTTYNVHVCVCNFSWLIHSACVFVCLCVSVCYPFYPQYMRIKGHGTCFMCVCVCVCQFVTLILVNRAVMRPTKGSSSFSYENLKGRFL